MTLDSHPSPSSRKDWPGLPGKLVVISGASASGKSTMVEKLVARPGVRLRVSISSTTREPRPGETPDVSYYFKTREQFEAEEAEGEYLEWAEVHGQLYGTPAGPIGKSLAEGICVILVIDVQGAMDVREQVPNALLIFVHAPSPEVLEARLRSRATDDEASIQRRLTNARNEVALADRYDHQIINDHLDQAVDALAAILNQHHCGA